MTKELKAKVLLQFNENQIEYGNNSLTGGYIDDKLDKVVECFSEAFKELLEEKTKELKRYYLDFLTEELVISEDGEYIEVEDLENILGIKI